MCMFERGLTSDNKALSARAQQAARLWGTMHREVILPTCLSLTESVTALAHEVSLGMSGFL